jgi:hypothetical protein
MTRHLHFTLAALVGAFFIYCTRDQLGGDGGFVADAAADGQTGCCTAAPNSFTSLAEGTLDLNSPQTQAIAVGNYREVVVYLETVATESSNCTGACCPHVGRARFRASSSASFGSTGQDTRHGARLRVDGSELRLQLEDLASYSFCSRAEYRYAVAGVE